MAEAILHEADRGVTLIDATGGYSRHEIRIVMVVCYKRDAGHVLRIGPRLRPQSLRHHRIGFGHLRRRIPQTDPTPLTCPMERYADIVLPLAQPAYTYAVADGLDVEEGQAVAVQFGVRRIYTGIVWRIHGRRPDFPRINTVSRVLYDRPLLDARQRALWEWMADYYLCTLGEVMRFALPQTIKPSGNSEQEFADREYRPRTELYAALDASLHDEERFHDLMERLSRRAPRQYAALLAIASAEGGDRISTGEVPRRLLEADAATLAALQKKGLVTLTRRERSVERGSVRFQLPTLTPAQQSCLDTIRNHFDAGRRTVLLHGITGSGKTELYIHLIAEALARGGDVLLLVPEIAITAQLIARLERIFGSRVTAYHSKLTLARRTESYLRLTRSDGGELVVGARSALFLPLRHLQLIVVDEEHDTGYKQTDAQPRYNARDVAVVMARLREARTVLGSATPSLEKLRQRTGRQVRAGDDRRAVRRLHGRRSCSFRTRCAPSSATSARLIFNRLTSLVQTTSTTDGRTTSRRTGPVPVPVP